MKKQIIVTMIAGGFFAASVVAPAFATGPNDNVAVSPISQQLPQRLPDRIPSTDAVLDRLKNLDIGTILDRDDIVTNPLPVPIELPHIERLPDIDPGTPVNLPEPLEPPERIDLPGSPEVTDPPDAPEAADLEVDEAVESGPEADAVSPSVPVKEIVDAARAEKAAILASYGGDRRAAKADLKAAQMRMVESIKANKGAGKKAKNSNRGKPSRGK